MNTDDMTNINRIVCLKPFPIVLELEAALISPSIKSISNRSFSSLYYILSLLNSSPK